MGRNGMKKERSRRRKKEEMKAGRARHGRARQCVPSTGEYGAPLPLPDDRPLDLDCDCDPPVPLGAKRAYASRSAASLSSAACRCARASASGSCRNGAGIALCGADGSSPLPGKPSNSVGVPGASTSAAASRRIPLRTLRCAQRSWSVSTGVPPWEAVERFAALTSLSCVGPASSAVRARRSSVLWVCAALTRVVLPCGGGVSRIGA
ncbi:hypothetical protein B0H14DRAFT_1529742 [Mycena olivaceomarginata]|nr:hypothetical protein B0H14DRAFT_1529742 [Mycena olivaceomarginata]